MKRNRIYPVLTFLCIVFTSAAASAEALTIQEVFRRGNLSAVAITAMESKGSGFIFTADGHILTNRHVIEGATGVTVRIHDGAEYPAVIVGSDTDTDIAVLKICAAGLTPAVAGNSDNITVGDQVFAIGNPLGELPNSLSVGYISAKKRTVHIDGVPRLLLQTDTPVSPGSSGGPLFNVYGEVVGVVSAKTIASGVEGIGFAIPINIAICIADEIMQQTAPSGSGLSVFSVTPL
jgi:serine protease Do